MFLTKPQRAALDLIRSLGGVRRGQLRRLLKPYGPPSPEQLDAMLRQLSFGGFVFFTGDIVCASGADPPDKTFLDAIDVMLEITDGAVMACSAGHRPVLLRFLSDGEKARCFFVLSGDKPALHLPLKLLRGQRAIVMLSENDGALRAALPPDHFVAVPDRDGRRRFFRCGGK